MQVFKLAKERDLDLDFHVDENGNEAAKGLLYVSEKAIQHGYQGRVVCGHCWCASALAKIHIQCCNGDRLHNGCTVEEG